MKRSSILTSQLLLIIVLALFYAWISPLFFYHNDLGWHLASGDLILQQKQIPITDPWSYNSKGAPWYNLSWLWDILISLIYRNAGGVGLLFLTIMVGVSSIYIISNIALKLGAREKYVCLLGVLIGIDFPFYAPPDIFFGVTPQQVTILFSVILLYFLARIKENHNVYTTSAITLLFIVWCNMHGGFIFGFATLLIALLSAFITRDSKATAVLIPVLILASLAMLCTPYGFNIVEGVKSTLGHSSQSDISEWKPLYQEANLAFLLPSLVYTILFLFSFFKLRREFLLNSFKLNLALLSMVLLIKGALSERYFVLFLIVSLPITTLGIGRRHEESEPKLSPFLCGFMAIITILTIPILFFRNPNPNDLPDMRDPKLEIQYILANYPKARLLNHWNYGSFLIFETRGSIPHFIDGRAGTAFPDEVFADLKELARTKSWDRLLSKYSIDTVLWPIADEDSLAWFRTMPQWREVYRGKLAIVLVKG